MRCRRLIGFVVAAAVLVAGCCIEPPLHLRKAVTTKVVLSTTVNVSVMWQVDWQAHWQFAWNTAALGPVGYTDPSTMRLHVYTHGSEGYPVSHTVHNFVGNTGMFDVFLGTHDLLFHNNDSETLLFYSDGELEPVHCHTRIISRGLKTSSPVYTTTQKAAGLTKTDDEIEDEAVTLAPDGLFTLYDPSHVITDNPDDYIYEDGKYVLKIQGELYPASYIYLFQIKLLNNDGRVIGSNGGAAITGMAEGVNVQTRESHTTTVSVPMDLYMDRSTNMMGARLLTFGIPGCNPYDQASVDAAPAGKHFLVMNITYANGSWRNIRADVTDQIRALPLGGVVTLEIDVNDFPPDESAGGGSGFNALVDDWEEEQGSTTIIN